MPWYPEAVRKQLTVPNRAKPSGRIAMPAPVRINLHTAVSNSYSLAWDERNGNRAGYFNTAGAGGVFSHFYVRKDGVVEQMQDTAYRASCDLDGNPDTISIETWDGYKSGFPGYWANDSDVPPWNAAQVAGLIGLVRWLYETHPSIPRVLAKSNRRGYESRGLSFHRLGAPGYALYTQAEGGLLYTTSYKKRCPGNRRISQIPAIHRAALDTDTDLERWLDAMDTNQLRQIIREESQAGANDALKQAPDKDRADEWGASLRDSAARAAYRAGANAMSLARVEQRLAALAAKEGVAVDEAQIAKDIAALIAPQVRDAVLDAAQAGGSPEAIADAVVARLGTALTQD